MSFRRASCERSNPGTALCPPILIVFGILIDFRILLGVSATFFT